MDKQEFLKAMQPLRHITQVFYVGKIQPTEETRLQSRKWQDRSKYLGNGELRPEPELSETDKARLALMGQNEELITGNTPEAEVEQHLPTKE